MGRLTPEQILADARPIWPLLVRDLERCLIQFEVADEAADTLLPVGVDLLDSPARALFSVERGGQGHFGAQTTARLCLRVRYQDQPYLYRAATWTTSDALLLAERERWGAPCRLANVELGWQGAELLATVERPAGVRLATATCAVERAATPDDASWDLPWLSLRLLPGPDSDSPPAVAQLVAADVVTVPVVGSDGRAERYWGPASLSFDTPALRESTAPLRPRQVLGALIERAHREIRGCRVLHDWHAEALALVVARRRAP